jgi:energy-coupling factor transport system substrate-specific component
VTIISKKKQFAITFAAFLVLGASFKVMTLIEGLTEIRPVNAIPPVAGLCFGWVGGLACGIGNLFADFFGSLAWTSILGVVANCVAAVLPYKLWHLFSDEAPNLHAKKNILLYLAIGLLNAFTTAWLLAFGLDLFFGMWIPTVYTYVFFNNFGFSAMFGMPLLIVLTSDSVKLRCEKPPRFWFFDKFAKLRMPVCIAYTALMIVVFLFMFVPGLGSVDRSWMYAVSAPALAGLIVLLV